MGYVYCFIPLTLVSSVGRAWDCSEKISGHPRVSGSIPERGNNYTFLFLIGKFAQRSNLTKTEMVTEPNEFFDLLYSPEFEVSDARLVNDETVEVHYRNVGSLKNRIIKSILLLPPSRQPTPV